MGRAPVRLLRATLLLALLHLAGPPPTGAAWPTDPAVNLPVCAEPGQLFYSAIASDGAGGAIIVWGGLETGFNFHAQHLSASGVPLWGSPCGVPLCSAAGQKDDPQIVADGAGGAFVAWIDYRDGHQDLYAQHIDASGALLWAPDGVPVCMNPIQQTQPHIVADGAGGVIIVWTDYDPAYDVFAQRLDAAGVPQWAINGIPVIVAPAFQFASSLVSDGAGGAIVFWSDSRHPSDPPDIRAQRINPAGIRLWAPDGAVVCDAPGSQQQALAVPDGAGGAIAGWYDLRNPSNSWQMFAQRVDDLGARLWDPSGVLVSSALYQNWLAVAADGSGGVVFGWQDVRNLVDGNLYAQRLDAAGAPQWTTDGVPFCLAPGDQNEIRMTGDGSGGVFVTWGDSRDPAQEDIYAQHLDPSGAPLWTVDGQIVTSAPDFQYSPKLVADAAGGAILTWDDNRSGEGAIYAQRVPFDQPAASSVIAPQPPATCITPAHPCVAASVTIARTDATPVRGFSVTLQLSANLSLCPPNIVEGSYLSAIGVTAFQTIDNGGGSYTVDGAILGTPCGATAASGTLFTLDLASAIPSGTGTVTVTGATLRDCANGPVAASAGPAVSIAIDNTTPDAITDLAAAQVTSGNGTGPTTGIRLTWTTGGAGAVSIYRAPFGSYPEYDDDSPGLLPPGAPSYPPAGPWTLATDGATSPYTDTAAPRGFWYYAGFVIDECGNVSAVSNSSGGTLNYLLGDVSNGLTPGVGDNQVYGEDISLLGSNYGISGEAAVDAVDYLDVGPTVTGAADARPQPDDRIQFEDLIIFAINYNPGGYQTPRLAAAPATAGVNALTLGAPARVAAGERFTVTFRLEGAGDIQGISAQLAWDAEVAEPLAVEAGDLITESGGVVLSAKPGNVDAALLGAGRGLAGDGALAIMTFRAKTDGDPRIGLASVNARDAANRKVDLAGATPAAPLATAFAAPAPNPFQRGTTLSFSLAKGGPVELAVFAVDGRRVRTLANEPRAAGVYRMSWDGADDGGRPVRPGMFYARLDTPQGRFTRTLVMVK